VPTSTAPVPVPTHLDTFTTWQEAGTDSAKINALFEAVKTESQDSTDHHAQMTDQGVPFGSAQYPIYFNEPSGTYFRAAHHGLEEWNADDGTWNQVFGTVEGKTKVWEGVPFTGQLKVPDTMPGSFLGESYGNPLDYQPEPGELVQAATFDLGNGKQQTAIIAFPDGNPDGPGFLVNGGNVTTPDNPKKTSIKLPDNWKEDTDFGTPVTLHDPFADTPDVVDTVTHHEGPSRVGPGRQAPDRRLPPSPGETLWVAKLDSGQVTPLSKQDDGTYRRILSDGSLGSVVFTSENLKDYAVPGQTVSHYTWTYLPAGADAPTAVAGLPQGFAPYVPSGNESLLKVTLPNGKTERLPPEAARRGLVRDGLRRHGQRELRRREVQPRRAAEAGREGLAGGQVRAAAPAARGHEARGPGGADLHEQVRRLSGRRSRTRRSSRSPASRATTDPWFFVQDEPGEELGARAEHVLTPASEPALGRRGAGLPERPGARAQEAAMPPTS
jgi:hypothetical protein